jgi:hypothetical protein
MKLTLNLIIILFAATYILSGCTKEGQTIETKVPVEVVKRCRVISSKSYNASGSVVSESKFYYSGRLLDSIVSVDPNANTYYKIFYAYQSPTIRIGKSDFNGTISPGYTKEFLNEFGESIESITYNDQNQITSRSTREISCQ